MDEEGGSRLLEQAFALWFQPEVERRTAAGTLSDGLVVWAGQVIMDPDRKDPIVRLNSEVRGVLTARAARPIAAGELVRPEDLKDLVAMSLTDEHPNAGHMSALCHGDHWYIFFDFRYNAARIQSLLSSADQFLQAARLCIEQGLSIPAVDNLYDAVQLMAKCFLLMHPDRQVLESKSHGFIETRFNQQGKLGNVSTVSVRVLNRLRGLRPKTRYTLEPVAVPSGEMQRLLEDTLTMRAELEGRRPTRESRKVPGGLISR